MNFGVRPSFKKQRVKKIKKKKNCLNIGKDGKDRDLYALLGGM